MNKPVNTTQEEKTETETDKESINIEYCDIYELYNALQFYWIAKLFIDTRSQSNFQKQTIFHAINLPSIPLNDNSDVLQQYKNVSWIYIISNNELDVSYYKQLVSILEKYKAEFNDNVDENSDENDEEDDWLTFEDDETQEQKHDMKNSDNNESRMGTGPISNGIEIKILKDEFSVFYQMFPYLCYSPKTTYGDQFIEYPNHIINNRLYLGNINHSRNELILKTLKITHIVNVSEKLNAFEDDNELNIKYLQCVLLDNENQDIQKYFNKACVFINNTLNKDKNNRILCHCNAGISRSSTIIMAYLIKMYKMKYEEAYQYVLKRRDIIKPNPGFVKQLQLFEAKVNE
eukprot:174805_1